MTATELRMERAGLLIEAGNHRDAFKALAHCKEFAERTGRIGDYVRVGRLLLDNIELSDAVERQYEAWQVVVRAMACANADLGRRDDAQAILDEFGSVVPRASASFVDYCDTAAYAHWALGDFQRSLHHAKTGHELKEKAQLDTACECVNNLALATRDLGKAEEAEALFLKSAGIDTVEALLESSESEGSFATTYGNVGRCRFLLGDYRIATTLFCRSYLVLHGNDEFQNMGYAAKWISELPDDSGLSSEDRQQLLLHAFDLWEPRNPPRAKEIADALGTIPDRRAERLSSTQDYVHKLVTNLVTVR
jgi:tetratricopeptide (TPR) repeat protein